MRQIVSLSPMMPLVVVIAWPRLIVEDLHIDHGRAVILRRSVSSHGGHAGTPPLARRQQLHAKSIMRFFSDKLR